MNITPVPDSNAVIIQTTGRYVWEKLNRMDDVELKGVWFAITLMSGKVDDSTPMGYIDAETYGEWTDAVYAEMLNRGLDTNNGLPDWGGMTIPLVGEQREEEDPEDPEVIEPEVLQPIPDPIPDETKIVLDELPQEATETAPVDELPQEATETAPVDELPQEATETTETAPETTEGAIPVNEDPKDIPEQ